MIHDVTAVELVENYLLRLTFDDGTHGDVDIAALVRFDGVSEALRDPATFRKVRIDSETGTIAWPNGADLDPLVLYAKVAGVTVEDPPRLATGSPALSRQPRGASTRVQVRGCSVERDAQLTSERSARSSVRQRFADEESWTYARAASRSLAALRSLVGVACERSLAANSLKFLLAKF